MTVAIATSRVLSRGLDPGWTQRHDPLVAVRRMKLDPDYRRRVIEAFAHSGRGRRRDLVRAWSQAVQETRDPAARAELGAALTQLRRVELRFLRLQDVSDADFHATRRRHDLRMWLHHRPPGGERGVLLSGPGPALASFERELGSQVVTEVPARRLVFRLDFEWAPARAGDGRAHHLEWELQGWEAAEVAIAIQDDVGAFVAEKVRAGEGPGYRWGFVRRIRWAVRRRSSGELLACGARAEPLPID